CRLPGLHSAWRRAAAPDVSAHSPLGQAAAAGRAGPRCRRRPPPAAHGRGRWYRDAMAGFARDRAAPALGKAIPLINRANSGPLGGSKLNAGGAIRVPKSAEPIELSSIGVAPEI